jgi:hypothetical protein
LLGGLKKALLSHIVDIISLEKNPDVTIIESAFNQLLALPDYEKAINFIVYQLSEHPEKWPLFYFLGQAQWLDGKEEAAIKSYIYGLLYYPEKSFLSRIESSKLLELIHTYGIENAPSYEWIQSALPFVEIIIPIEPRDEIHANAIKCYRLLQQAHQSLEKNDKNSITISYRAQLKAANPELYQAYFKLLTEGKRK